MLFADWFGGRSGWSTMTVGRVLLVLTILLALTLVVLTLRARAVSMATVGGGRDGRHRRARAAVPALPRRDRRAGPQRARQRRRAAPYLGLLCLLAILAGAWRTMADERKDSAISLRQTERVLAVRGPAREAPPARDPGRGEPRS